VTLDGREQGKKTRPGGERAEIWEVFPGIECCHVKGETKLESCKWPVKHKVREKKEIR